MRCAILLLLIPLFFAAQLRTPVTLKWGIPDTGTVVGKYFSYSIPSDAFSGDIISFEASDAAGGPLPDWLTFNADTRVFLGVPGEPDVGPLHVMLTAVGGMNATHTSIAKDVFTIQVKEASHKSGKVQTLLDGQNDGKQYDCGPTEPTVTLAILLDVDFHTLTASDRAVLLNEAANALKVRLGKLRLLSRDYVRQFEQEMLMAGPGDDSRRSSRDGSFLMWKIGCGNKVTKELAPEVARIEQGTSSGVLAARLGYGILSWQAVSGKVRAQKRRRQAGYITATPTYKPTPYTSIPEIETRPIEEFHPSTTQRKTSTTTTTVTAKATRPTTTTTPRLVVSRKPEDRRPEVRNRMDAQTCYRGIVCRIEIKWDIFWDKEDGDTHQLSLSLAKIDESGPNFLVLGGRSRNIFGLSLKTGQWKYQLAATDSGGQMIASVFRVSVEEPPGPSDDPSHIFTLSIDYDYDQFMSEPEQQVDFVRKIAEFWGDRGSRWITVRDIKAGSTVVSWTNNSLATDVCPDQALKTLRQRFVTPSGKLSRQLVGHMKPFNAIEGSLELSGVCLEETTSEVPLTEEETGTEEKEVVTPSGAGEENFLVSTVVPIIIIVVLLVAALIIACYLYRRNRSAKAAKREVKNLYVSKGAPIIFPDEVEPGDREPLATSPLLIKEERAPLQPPEVRNQPEFHEMQEQNSFRGTPRMTTTENPLYKPPNPIADSGLSTRSPRAKHTLPHQREPPPYVPP